MRASILVLGVGLLVLPGAAQAHFNLLAPPPSSTTSASLTGGGKGIPPCGPDTASTVVTSVQGGHALPVKLTETVLHPGFYRFALSINSRSELPLDNVVKDSSGKVLSPTGMPSGTSATAEWQMNPVFPVLADNMFAHTSGNTPLMFTGEVMLPNVTCAKCTLQVIEFMAMHGPNGADGYFYHHCADLKITADPNLPVFNPNGAGGAGGAGGASNGGASSGGAAGQASGGAATGGAASGGAATGGAAMGGAAGVSAGAPAVGGSAGSGASGAPGSAGGAPSSAGTTSAGASASGASSTAGTSSAGASSTGTAGSAGATDNTDGGGCSLSPRSSGSTPTLALLAGLLLAGARRRRARRSA